MKSYPLWKMRSMLKQWNTPFPAESAKPLNHYSNRSVLIGRSPLPPSELWRPKRFLWPRWESFTVKAKRMKNPKVCGPNWSKITPRCKHSASCSIPCLATLAIIKRELNSWKMAVIEAGGLFALAYIMTFIVYQAGTLLKIGTTLIN